MTKLRYFLRLITFVTIVFFSTYSILISQNVLRFPLLSNISSIVVQFSFQSTTSTRSDHENTTIKIILWYFKTRYQPPMPDLVKLQHCPEMNCRMTSNRKYLNQSSAVVFAAQLISEKQPPQKSKDQVWIFHNHESPLDQWSYLPTFRRDQWKGMFNWTMDYRTEADIRSVYGIMKKKPKVIKRNYTDIVLKKKGLVAWMVSNCHTEGKRELYVKKLKNYVPVAVFGYCGDKQCQRSKDDSCLKEISNYKFYLSFENAFCPDYVSEKFYRFYNTDVIPVARGAGPYSPPIPQGTYINTGDFKSVKDLAVYLQYLDKNNDKYIEYLKRKDAYESVFEAYFLKTKLGKLHYMHYRYEHTPFCEVCKRLSNIDNYVKTYKDIATWFDGGRCYQPPDVNQF